MSFSEFHFRSYGIKNLHGIHNKDVGHTFLSILKHGFFIYFHKNMFTNF